MFPLSSLSSIEDPGSSSRGRGAADAALADEMAMESFELSWRCESGSRGRVGPSWAGLGLSSKLSRLWEPRRFFVRV